MENNESNNESTLADRVRRLALRAEMLEQFVDLPIAAPEFILRKQVRMIGDALKAVEALIPPQTPDEQLADEAQAEAAAAAWTEADEIEADVESAMVAEDYEEWLRQHADER